MGYLTALQDSEASSELDEGMKKPVGPAGSSDVLPPACQRASCPGSIHGCPCKDTDPGCTEARPNNPGAEGQDPWLSLPWAQPFPLASPPTLRPWLQNAGKSAGKSFPCLRLLSKQVTGAAAGRFCRFLFGFAKFCFLSTGAENGAWCSVPPAGPGHRPAGPWATGHLAGKRGVSGAGGGEAERGAGCHFKAEKGTLCLPLCGV